MGDELVYTGVASKKIRYAAWQKLDSESPFQSINLLVPGN